MNRLPGALVVIDVHRERNAVREARKLGIPTVCLIDTDSDPEFADLPIPGNDDAMRAIDMVLTHLADAVDEGIKGRKEPEPEAAARTPRRRATRPTMGRTEEGQPEMPVADAPAGEAAAALDGTPPMVHTGVKDTQDPGLAPASATEPETS
jgi:small subunit ribosomal protein S2